MTINLEDLPVEAIARILSFLDYKDSQAVLRLNKLFADVYNSFPELQYSLALQEAGMIDSDPSVDIRTKLKELERRERAWRTMDLTRKVTVKVTHWTSHIYDLSGGIYLLGDCKSSLASRETSTLRFFDLTTCTSGPDVRSEPWPEMRLDSNIVDIGFGLHEFDLVAVIGIKHGPEGSRIVLSLRELSTGAPHPLARNPDITVDNVNRGHGKLAIMMEIVGPRLLLLLSWHQGLQLPHQRSDQDKLLLFNWWDGTKVAVETAPELTWNGFVFLSPDLVLIPHNEHGLEIIRLPDVTKGYCSKGFERVLSLALPVPRPTCRLGAIQCRAEPNPIGEPHPSLHDGTQEEFWSRMRARKRRPPFMPDPGKAIVLLQIYYREHNQAHEILNLMGQWGMLRHNVSLVVHRKFLLDLVQMFCQSPKRDVLSGSDDAAIAPRTLAWAEWGSHARWQADDTHVSNWITTSAGQRYIGVDENGHIVIKDFNQTAVERARKIHEARPSSHKSTSREFSKEGTSIRAHRPRIISYVRAVEEGTLPEVEGGEESEWESESESEDPFDTAWLQHARYRPIVLEHADEPPPSTNVESESIEAPASASTSVSTSSPHLPTSPAHSTSTDQPGYDPSWKRVRILEGYNNVEKQELQQLFSEGCTRPLPCVEYRSQRPLDYDGRLLDEERIIGLRIDEQTGAIVEFDVFTL